LKKKYTIRRIAELMERSPNTVSLEVRRNKVAGRYVPQKAQHKTHVRRKYAHYRGKKIVEHAELEREIVRRLKDGQKPGNIARRITKRERHLPPISKDSIYRWLKSTPGARTAAWLWLRRKKRRRRMRGRRKKLEGRKFIEKRPKIANMRGRVGDIEFDFILSGKSGKGILLTESASPRCGRRRPTTTFCSSTTSDWKNCSASGHTSAIPTIPGRRAASRTQTA
jgi:IS30 family transposase